MTFLPNRTITRLQEAVDLPDPGGTRYTLVHRIGRGGMGTVYLVEDATLGRRVAMKVLDTTIEAEELSARLRREAQVIALLEHPGIVPVHEVGTLPDGRLYYTMKYVQGKQLDEYISPSMSIHERLRIFQKICEPVAFAHSKEVIHRDLKPQNIMVGAFGEVLVVDWGIAKNLKDRTGAGMRGDPVPSNGVSTVHGAVVGTPAYMSPEQQRGGDLDARSDVYALGAILHFLLAGLPPESGPPDRTVVRAGSPRVRAANPKIGKSLEAICLKALSANVDTRYAGVVGLASDITLFLDGNPVSAYRENLLEKIDRWMGRNRFLVFLILAYLVMRILLLMTSGR